MKHSRSLMSRTLLKNCLAVLIVALVSLEGFEGSGPSISVRQITFGPENHFFGYVGHVQNIPWNGNGRYILALQTTFQDHMPCPEETANVVLIDTHNDHSVQVVDRTHAWNLQQGTMFYWNPESLYTFEVLVKKF